MPTVAPYGEWRSPISAAMAAESAVRFQEVQVSGDVIYWVEMRPAERGRYVLMRREANGRMVEATPPEMNVRTLVHEYGGGAFAAGDDFVVYSNYADQRLYVQRGGGPPRAITQAGYRYADGVADTRRNRLICVREDHTVEGSQAINSIVAVDLDGAAPDVTLASGYDFYSNPRLNADGSQLAWIAWNHPQMPWTKTDLWLADVRPDGAEANARCLVRGDESVNQPMWGPDGSLLFLSDRSGWWNLYRWTEEGPQPLLEREAEFSRPQWVFDEPTYGVRPNNKAVCSYTAKGRWRLGELDLDTGYWSEIDTPYTSISGVHVSGKQAVFIGGSPTRANAVVWLDLETGACETLRSSSDLQIDTGYVSVPQPVEFPTEGGLTAHGFFYAPRNADFVGPDDERPPLMVISHGGPTSATTDVLSLSIQYWTSRGIAVLDVNYGGSTGYGRAYRQRLDGMWGVVDVDDCVNGARWLAEQGLVDGGRMVIRGGSAGGFTTLAALTFCDAFRAGASYYGVSDLEALVLETHKFESRYLDGLIGPYPERIDLYKKRSPIYHVDQLARPIIFFQGLEDKVVPPNQAEWMVDALRAKGVPVAYVAFEGEQHGFRQAANIVRALTGELYFYSRMLGFTVSEAVEPVEIENWREPNEAGHAAMTGERDAE